MSFLSNESFSCMFKQSTLFIYVQKILKVFYLHIYCRSCTTDSLHSFNCNFTHRRISIRNSTLFLEKKVSKFSISLIKYVYFFNLQLFKSISIRILFTHFLHILLTCIAFTNLIIKNVYIELCIHYIIYFFIIKCYLLVNNINEKK